MMQTQTHTLIEKNPLPLGDFLFNMFPNQEPGRGGPPSKHLVQILQGGSSSSGSLIREHSKYETPPGGGVSFDQLARHLQDTCFLSSAPARTPQPTHASTCIHTHTHTHTHTHLHIHVPAYSKNICGNTNHHYTHRALCIFLQSSLYSPELHYCLPPPSLCFRLLLSLFLLRGRRRGVPPHLRPAPIAASAAVKDSPLSHVSTCLGS